MNKILLILTTSFFVFACQQAPKKEIAGGTSEETNTLAFGEVQSTIGHDGHSQTALSFQKPQSFAASEILGGRFSAATSFEIHAWLKIDSIPQKSELPHNLIGKFESGDAALPSEFSLALVNGACGSEMSSLAFFLTGENSAFRCEQAVLSKTPIKAGLWTLVEVNWDGRYLTLIQDGVQVAREERILASLPFSELPVYFGKSGVAFTIDAVSLK
ncbi:hypothetical protein AGMMS49938_09350 [Fibrobacterales bacterium]|nr:hypothetical protein AGMMS49938_09350 [Fibrobacterales bacterium]